MRRRKSALKEAMEMEEKPRRRKPAAQPEPLPERAPARGLEGRGFSEAETRAIRRSADGGTPRTDMGSRPKSPQEMLEAMEGAGPKKRRY